MIEIDLCLVLVYLIVNLFELGIEIEIEPEIGVIEIEIAEIGIAVIDCYYFEFVGIGILLN
jgi:hypothetical protein